MSRLHCSKLKIYIWLLLGLVLGISGCFSDQESTTDLPTTTIIIITPPEAIITRTNGGNLSTTPHPLPTFVASSTEAPVLSTHVEEHQQQNDEGREIFDRNSPADTPAPSTSTPTTTPVPTLSPEQEGAFLSLLLGNNGDCELPCWWGVTPGQTGSQEARDLFASQGIDDWVISHDENYALMGLGYPKSGSSSYFRDVIIRFEMENNLIQYIGVEGNYRRELNSQLLQDWYSYSPSEILKRFDIPSYIELVEVENSPYYRLTFSYELLGIEISYIVPFKSLDNGKSEVCFDLQNVDFIGLSLYSPENTKDVPVGIIPNRLDSYTSWETTTGLNKENFRQLLEDDRNLPCVEVN